ncbi:MAG: class I SAM-dependent methyltransferase [Elusimicrobia bacterium]|nr:class I SAM-dependent methyltransferase [Elusimicrobiota bacterium]
MNGERDAAELGALLARAGVTVGGSRPWDIRVLAPGFFARVRAGGSLAAGEAYADGWWESDRLDEFFHRVFKAGLDERLSPAPWSGARRLLGRLLGLGSRGAAGPDGSADGAVGGDVYRAMLGQRMSFTSGYWKDARGLDEAVDGAMELACRKLELKPGMSVLDLGCGWGAFARHAARTRGVSVVGVDIACERVDAGRELCKGLPVALRVQDYGEVRGRFDRVVSFGLLEQLGPEGCGSVMAAASRCLKADGVALIQTAARNAPAARRDPWLERWSVAGGAAPSLSSLVQAMEGRFVVEDAHNLGPHYDATLMAWHDNLSRRWPGARDARGERLYRALKFSLLSAAGAFRARRAQLFQLVMSRPGRAQPRCRPELAGESRMTGGVRP